MVTVAQIAATAFNAVSASITDSINATTMEDENGVSQGTGRSVVDFQSPGGGFPKNTLKDRTQNIFLEGFAVIPQEGWSVTIKSVDYLIIWVHDVVVANTFFAVETIPKADLLNVTVEFQTNSRTANGSGGFDKVWGPIVGAPTQAYFMAKSGNEVFGDDVSLMANTKNQLVVPFFAGVKAEDRLLVNGRFFNITFVDNMEDRSTWLRLELEGGVAT